MSYGDSSLSVPIVILADKFESSRAFDKTTGLTHNAAIGFPIFIRLTSSNLTSGRIFPSGPLNAQSVKFFALPNPPGITKASMSAGLTSKMFFTSPRAIRALSISMLRDSFISSPVR